MDVLAMAKCRYWKISWPQVQKWNIHSILDVASSVIRPGDLELFRTNFFQLRSQTSEVGCFPNLTEPIPAVRCNITLDIAAGRFQKLTESVSLTGWSVLKCSVGLFQKLTESISHSSFWHPDTMQNTTILQHFCIRLHRFCISNAHA
ncbi:hypothetical protein [Aestuariivirga sp.]|uniref:hypothetical protein n=1 Tax=Aestuariivirga sp. TaxID=2650926 RepID=UPI0039E2A4AE